MLDLQSADVSVEPLHSDFNALPMTGRSTYMLSTPQNSNGTSLPLCFLNSIPSASFS